MTLVSNDIFMKSWAIAARHLARGQRDPTLMIADAIAQERGLPVTLPDPAPRQTVTIEDPAPLRAANEA